MEKREIKEDSDIKKAAKLAEICFHESNYEDNIKFYKNLKECEIFGLFENNELYAAGGSYDFNIFIRDHLFRCAGIAHVMTHPIQRKKGYVRRLMEEILISKFEEGYTISSLWPFKHSFYQKFGFEIIEKPISYRFSPSDIKKDLKIGEEVNVRETKEEDFPILNEIAKNALNKYTRIIGKYDAWALRGSLQKFITYIFEKEKKPVGYISFKFRKVKEKEWGSNLVIVDFAYVDLETKKAIFAFLRKYEADIGEISLTIPYEEEILGYLNDIKDKHKYAQWPAMVRILNLKKTIENLIFPSDIDINLYTKIKDEIIKENEGLWLFRISNGKCLAEKINQETIPDEEILNVDINQITQIIVGYSKVENIFETSKEKIPKVWLNEEIFPPVPCSVMVWF